jgi:hypothetical protein
MVNSHDHRDLLDTSMIGLRYKTNSQINLDPDMLSFYNFGTHSSNINKTIFFENANASSNFSSISLYNYFFLDLLNGFNSTQIKFTFFNIFNNLYSTFVDYINIVYALNLFNFIFLPSSNLSFIFSSFFSNFSFLNVDYYQLTFYTFHYGSFLPKRELFFQSQDNNTTSNLSIQNFSEVSSSQRVSRFSTSLINYDYKTGHYIGN